MQRSNTSWYFLWRLTAIVNEMVAEHPLASEGLLLMMAVICNDANKEEQGNYAKNRLYEQVEEVIRNHMPRLIKGIGTASFSFSHAHLMEHDHDKSETYKSHVLADLNDIQDNLEYYLREPT